METSEQMSWVFPLCSSFFSTLSLKIPAALPSSTLFSQLSKAAGLCLGCSSLLRDLETASKRKLRGRTRKFTSVFSFPHGSWATWCTFLQTVVLYSILVCFLTAYQKTGRVLYWWSPHWQEPFHPLLHSSSVKFIRIGKIPLASMICPPGFQPQDEKPLAFSWSIKNTCNDALREQPSRWGTVRTKRCWRTPHTEDTGSPEAGGAVSLCHELHASTARSQWAAPPLE